MRRRHAQGTRRGLAAVALVVVLLMVNLIVIGMVITGGRDQDLVVRRLETIQAFYAAEAGMNMAIREMMEDGDEDGDGGTGSISDDGNSGNDPALGSGQVVVTKSVSGTTTTLESTGRCGGSQRKAQSTLEE
jgi:hypothetical protein